MNDVRIVGAGVVGLILAKLLAGKGIPTTVYEQKKHVGYPVKASGILSIKGINGLGIGYKKTIENELYGAKLHIGKMLLSVRSEKPVAYALDRLKLNEICYDEALHAGASIELGRRLSQNEIRNFTGNDIVVGADGAVSLVAKTFGFPPINSYVLTYRAEYNADVSDAGMVDLFFDRNITPGFFGWVAPIAKDKIEVAIGIDSKHGNSKTAFEKFIKTSEVQKIIERAKFLSGEASMIPLALRSRFVDEKNKALLVGDAAGQTKPSTGGGIIFGGNAAIIAAGTIGKYISGEGRLIDYQREWLHKFGADLRMHRLIRWTYSNLSTGALSFIVSALKALGIEGFLSKNGDMDSPIYMLKKALHI
ncbi:MAG: NAD(P)/FAD-dependent oxidoreductase [Candidatus Micrarchaeaceae archaeon]